MGLSLFAYALLLLSGMGINYFRGEDLSRPRWLRPLHTIVGWTLVFLVLLLLSIGIVGTIGQYGSLGHSSHLTAGLWVVALVIISATSGLNIDRAPDWLRPLHITTNLILFIGFVFVTFTGWSVVQKYLP